MTLSGLMASRWAWVSAAAAASSDRSPTLAIRIAAPLPAAAFFNHARRPPFAGLRLSDAQQLVINFIGDPFKNLARAQIHGRKPAADARRFDGRLPLRRDSFDVLDASEEPVRQPSTFSCRCRYPV